MRSTKTDDCIPKSDNRTEIRARLGVYTNMNTQTTIFAEEA